MSKFETRLANELKDMPTAFCLPSPIQIAADLSKFMQTESLLVHRARLRVDASRRMMPAATKFSTERGCRYDAGIS